MAMAVIMFSFGGLEMVGITAAEAADPRRSIPKATNRGVPHFDLLYRFADRAAVALSVGQVVEGGSPFVLIFHALNSNLVATVLNVVVLTAALSVYNSGVYANSRMLFGLASRNAPQALTRVNKRGVPVLSIALSALITSIGVLINYLMPGKAFELLMALVVSTLVINWVMICPAHLKFRAAKNRGASFPALRRCGIRSATTCAGVPRPDSGDYVFQRRDPHFGVADAGVDCGAVGGFMLTRRKGAKR